MQECISLKRCQFVPRHCQGFLNCLGTGQSIHGEWLEIRLECASGVRHYNETGVFDLQRLKENFTGIWEIDVYVYNIRTKMSFNQL